MDLNGWILQFDTKEARASQVEENPLFIGLNDYDALLKQLFPQYFTLHWDSTETLDIDYAKERFCGDLFFKLPLEYNNFGIEAVCGLVRLHSFFYPSDFYFNGVLHTDNINRHRKINWNHDNTGH